MAKRAKEQTPTLKIISVLTHELQRVPDVAERAGVSMAEVFALINDGDLRVRAEDMQTKRGRGLAMGIALA